MAKSSRKKIEEDERKILNELEDNAKESIDNIAKKVGVSRQKVWRIIKKLEADKAIWGYSAIVDKEKQNLKGFTILIKRTTEPVDDKLIDKLTVETATELSPKSQVKVESSIYVHGVYDWIITFSAEDIKQAKQFSEILKSTYQGYIAELYLLETMFSIREKGIINPEVKKLSEFI